MNVSKHYQHAIIQLLMVENMSTGEIYHYVQYVYGTECISHGSVFWWCSDFKNEAVETAEHGQVNYMWLSSKKHCSCRQAWEKLWKDSSLQRNNKVQADSTSSPRVSSLRVSIILWTAETPSWPPRQLWLAYMSCIYYFLFCILIYSNTIKLFVTSIIVPLSFGWPYKV